MVTVQIQPVVQPDYTSVLWLAFNAANLGVTDPASESYGVAQYQIFNENDAMVSGNTCSFSKAESDDHWDTDENFAVWLTENKLGYTPV